MLGSPDVNLCRAYMPLYCKHYKTGEVYNYNNESERARWNEKSEDGQSAWIQEDGKRWIATDVHSATAHNTLLALGYICEEEYKKYTHTDKSDIDGKMFKGYYRQIGKTFNFMRNYGSGAQNAADTLEISMDIANALVTGWSNTFPEVANYQRKVAEKINKTHHATNMYGRVYFLTDTSKAYKVGNYLVQGSCADLLKGYVVKIDKFLEENNCKTVALANIHDELQFLVYEGEEWIFPHIKRIMEDVSWMQVPVVVDLEITETNWAEKEERDVTEFVK